MAQSTSNAFRYARQLKHSAEGFCVWHPTTSGAVGDVGYLHDGYFNRLFNVFNAPDGLPSIPGLNQGIVTDMQDNSHLAWMNIEGGNYTVGAGLPAATDVVNLGFEISSHTADGAFLVPGGQARKVERYLEFQRLVEYLGDHYTAILRMFPHHPLDQCSLMILRGTTHAVGWCRGIARQTARGVSGTISINIPTLGIPVLGLDVATQRARLNHWLIGSGPPTDGTSTSPLTPAYCIIVKPVIVRRRTTLQFRIASAVVPIGERMKSFMSKFQTNAGSDVRSTSATQIALANTASGRVFDTSDTSDFSSYDLVGGDRSASSFQQLQRVQRLDDSPADRLLEDLLLEDEVDPRDELEELLDDFLDKHSDFDAVLGTSDLLFDFIVNYNHSACDTEIEYAFTELQTITPRKVAQIQRISQQIFEDVNGPPAVASSQPVHTILSDRSPEGHSSPVAVPIRTDKPDPRLSLPEALPKTSAGNNSPAELPIHSLSHSQPRDDIASELEVDLPPRALGTQSRLMYGVITPYYAPSPASAGQQQPEYHSPVKTRNGPVRGGRAAFPSPASSHLGSRLYSAASMAPIADSPYEGNGKQRTQSGSRYTPSPVLAYDRVPRTDASSSLSDSSPPPANPQQLTVATVDDRIDPAATLTTESLNSPLTFSPGEERLLIMATTADAFVHVDITGANSPEFIRGRMFSKLQISDHEQHRYAIYRTEGDELPFKNTPALSGEELLRLCLAEGDRHGNLKFIVLPSMRHPLPPIDTRASAPDASSSFSPLVRVNASGGHKPSKNLLSPRDRSDQLDAGYIASESEVDPPHRSLRIRAPSAAQSHAPSPASAGQHQQPEYLSPVKTRNDPVRGGRAAFPSSASSHLGSRLYSAAPIAPIEVGQYEGMQRTQSNDSKRHRIRNLPIPSAPQAPAPSKPEARPAMRPSAISSPLGKVNMGWLRDGHVLHSNSFQSPSSARPPSPRRQQSNSESSLNSTKSVENPGHYSTRPLPVTPTGGRLGAGSPGDPSVSASVPEPRSADPRTLLFDAPTPMHHMQQELIPDDAWQLDWMNSDDTSSIADTLYVPEKADPIMLPQSLSFTDESILQPEQSQNLRAVMDTARAASHESLVQPIPTPAPDDDDDFNDSILIYSSKINNATPVTPPPPISALPVTITQPMPYLSPSEPFEHQPIMVKVEDHSYSPSKSDEYDEDDFPVLKFAGGKRPRPQSRFITRASVTWNVRPPPQEVYDHLEEFFPEHDLDKPLLEGPVGGGAAAVAATMSPGVESPVTLLSAITSPLNARPRRGKTVRHIATEHKRMLDRTSKFTADETPEAAMFRKRSTKLWGTKVEEVVPRAVGVPSTIPESPSTTAKPVTRWVKGDLIGKGTYGKVFLALNSNTGEMMAVKQVELPKTGSDQQDHRQRIVVDAIKSESTTLRDLEHPNVVQYLGFEETSDHFNLFLEYVPGGSIAGVLRKLGKFDENVTKSFTEQILSGLNYLHSRGVWHRDLRGDNILVDAQGVCKISDFGISKRNADIVSSDQGATSMQGSIFWMAPEVLSNQGQGYNVKVDIWSLGCVFVEMVTGRRPWEDENIVLVMFKISAMRERPPVPQLDALGRDFCDLCFERDPALRPTAAALRVHPYLSLPPTWRFQDFVTAPAGY